MAIERARVVLHPKYWIAVVFGCGLALVATRIMTLQFRYAVAVTGALVVVCLAMILIRRIDDFLIYALVFNIPFMRFGKWLMPQDSPVPALGINVGLPELLLVIAYGIWFAQIFVARREELPKPRAIGFFIVLLLVTQCVSLLFALNKTLGIFDIIYNIKFILIAFFLAQKLKRKHLKGIIALFIFAIVLESGIGVFERLTGITNIGDTKGNVQHPDFGEQYAVPGIENETRAMGTTHDSHCLGLYFAMLLPVPFVLMTRREPPPAMRALLMGVFLIGVVGLVIALSRSGWLGFAVAAVIALGVTLFKWKQRRVVVLILLIVVGVSLAYPKTYYHLYRRVFQAPSSIMTARYEMILTALDIWRKYPLFGCGPGNYIETYNTPDIRKQDAPGRVDLPVHNGFLWIAAELGIMGVIAYYGMILLGMVYCWRTMSAEDWLAKSMGLAIFCALAAYLVDGITNPMFREAVPYAQLWVYVGLSTAFKRLAREPLT
jgi:hypothetical protein